MNSKRSSKSNRVNENNIEDKQSSKKESFKQPSEKSKKESVKDNTENKSEIQQDVFMEKEEEEGDKNDGN